MGELRSAKVMVSLEESFYEVLNNLLAEHGWSASSYFRALMITDLRERGLVDEEFLMNILKVPRAARNMLEV